MRSRAPPVYYIYIYIYIYVYIYIYIYTRLIKYTKTNINIYDLLEDEEAADNGDDDNEERGVKYGCHVMHLPPPPPPPPRYHIVGCLRIYHRSCIL